MTLTDVQSYIDAGMTSYEIGAGYALTGVRKASTFEDVDSCNGGKMVYAWLGPGVARTEASGHLSYELDVPIYVRGRIVGDIATLESDAVSMLDDLIRAVMLGDGDPRGPVYGRVVLVSFAEPQVNHKSRTADVLLVARATIYNEVQS